MAEILEDIGKFAACVTMPFFLQFILSFWSEKVDKKFGFRDQGYFHRELISCVKSFFWKDNQGGEGNGGNS